MKRPKYLDIIEFSPFALRNIFAVCLPFYEKGSSLREIERLTNISKSTIRNAFECAGHPLRSTCNRQLPFLATPKFMRSGTTPYGHTYLEGKLVKDPREYRNVQKIYLLWQKGESFRSIAKRLNVQKLTTRSGKKWNHEIIKRIIERQNSSVQR